MTAAFKDIMITYTNDDFPTQLHNLRQKIVNAAKWPEGDPRHDALTEIVNSVRTKGDAALTEFTKKFDDVDLTPQQFRIEPDTLKKAHDQIEPSLLASIRQSIANVRKYQSEIFTGKTDHPGVKYTPIERVGICVPGASAPLPSTVIMTVVPAQVAGAKDIVVVSPPRCEGSIHPVILAVCHELGIDEVYRLGGAQAVAALAYGTETIKKVYKIVGPGNTWVQMAKKSVFGISVDIDSIAGPSEVLIIANDQANPAWVAADMLSQAEHDPGSAIVFTDSPALAENILNELQKQTAQLQRAKQTENCLKKYSGIAVFENLDHAVTAANDFASEHLQVQCGEQSRQIAGKIQNAGAIFIGPYTPVAVGDYWAGPSHTLPTGMSAKFFSPLSSNDFIKSTSIIQYTKEQLQSAADHIQQLALTEGLDAHAKSVKIRTQK